MLPDNISHNLANKGLRDSELRRELCLRESLLRIQSTNQNNRRLMQLSVRVTAPLETFVTTRCSPSPFSIHIMDVVSQGSEKKMRGANTQGNVALMQNTKTIGNFPVSELPGNSMRRNFSLILREPEITSFISSSSALRSGPQPTSFGLSDFFPKAFFCGHARGLLTHPLRKVGQKNG